MDIESITAKIVAAFPTLEPFEQRLSIELYRQLARGEAVTPSVLASQLNVDVATVEESLQRWPGVYRDEQQRVTGYWGLSIPSAYSSSHVFSVAGRDLSAWCAWNTLFLPQLLGMSARGRR